jgi:hypothetical protein
MPHLRESDMTLRQALTRSLAEEQGARAVPFSARCFYPYRVAENGRTLPLVVSCSTLEEAVEGAKVYCIHKEHLLIREIGEGVDRLHIYAIKRKSAPRYVYKDYQTHRQHDLYAAPMCVIDAGILRR